MRCVTFAKIALEAVALLRAFARIEAFAEINSAADLSSTAREDVRAVDLRRADPGKLPELCSIGHCAKFIPIE